jgi:paraquat-inducible protein A
LHRVQPLPEKNKARCIRCGSLLYAHAPETLDRSLAFAMTGLVLMVIANIYPFLLMESQGTILETTLITGMIILAQQNMAGVAILVLLTSMLIPSLLLGSLVYVLGSIKWGYRLPARRRVFRLALGLRPWSMTEVFLLGILVSVVKLAKLASIIPGTALFSFLALVFVLAAVSTVLEPHSIWQKMEPW